MYHHQTNILLQQVANRSKLVLLLATVKNRLNAIFVTGNFPENLDSISTWRNITVLKGNSYEPTKWVNSKYIYFINFMRYDMIEKWILICRPISRKFYGKHANEQLWDGNIHHHCHGTSFHSIRCWYAEISNAQEWYWTHNNENRRCRHQRCSPILVPTL